MTYPLLCLALLAVALIVRIAAHLVVRRRGGRLAVMPSVIAAVALVILTLVFDNVMIAVGLFTYAPPHISGIHVGLAPIEDLSYPLATAIALPGIWALAHGGRRRDGRHT
jgi:small toxic polypeptide LdrA/B/C/D